MHVNYRVRGHSMLVKNALKNQTRPTNILSPHCRRLCSNSLSSYCGISYVLSNSVKLARVHVSVTGGLHWPQKLTFFLHLFCRLCHPTPTITASFPHNPSLWLLFRVGPGDRRRLTECICVCVHSCVLWKQSQLSTTAIHTWPWTIGRLKWGNEWGHFDLGLCVEKAKTLLFLTVRSCDYTWAQPKSRSDINLTFSSITRTAAS